MTVRCGHWRTRLTSVRLLRRGVRWGGPLTKNSNASAASEPSWCRTRSVMSRQQRRRSESLTDRSRGRYRIVYDILDDELVALVLRVGHRSEEHTSELQSRGHLVCRLLLEIKNNIECVMQ